MSNRPSRWDAIEEIRPFMEGLNEEQIRTLPRLIAMLNDTYDKSIDDDPDGWNDEWDLLHAIYSPEHPELHG